MNFFDLKMFETGNGGDLRLQGNDLEKAYSFENMPYLALFGGNPTESTPTSRNVDEQAFDFWGNNLFFPKNKTVQFNSETEKLLNSVGLNSGGRILIENAIKKDIKYLQEFAELKVNVVVSGIDNLSIGVEMVQPENGVERRFMYIWDGARLINSGELVSGNFVIPEGLEENLGYNL